jgi:hypothetical protein
LSAPRETITGSVVRTARDGFRAGRSIHPTRYSVMFLKIAENDFFLSSLKLRFSGGGFSYFLTSIQ